MSISGNRASPERTVARPTDGQDATREGVVSRATAASTAMWGNADMHQCTVDVSVRRRPIRRRPTIWKGRRVEGVCAQPRLVARSGGCGCGAGGSRCSSAERDPTSSYRLPPARRDGGGRSQEGGLGLSGGSRHSATAHRRDRSAAIRVKKDLACPRPDRRTDTRGRSTCVLRRGKMDEWTALIAVLDRQSWPE